MAPPLPDSGPGPRTVNVAWSRLPGWVARYDARHPDTTWRVTRDLVTASSPEGSRVAFSVPMKRLEVESLDGLFAHLERPWQVGVVLVRRGGFAVARVVGADIVESKVGRRHVQGKTKAGGWSQQRFARRRDNQAKVAFDAAAGYVHEILLPHAVTLDLVATGGDRAAVDAVFASRALRPLAGRPQKWLGGVPDPKRAVVLDAVETARSVSIEIIDLVDAPLP